MTYELNLKEFRGPLDALLELIEARKMEITGISLAEVTDDFLKYLQTLTGKGKEIESHEASHMRLVADFIVVASRLLLIKSKSLLPDLALTKEEEAEIKDLEVRLRLYRELRPAMKILNKLWRDGSREFSRPYFLSIVQAFIPSSAAGGASDMRVFYPGEGITGDALRAALAKTFLSFEALAHENRVIRETIISLEETMREVLERLAGLPEASFRGLSKDKTRSQIVIAFIAILHLAKEELIFLEQKEHLSDIIIKKSDAKHAN